MRDPASRIDDRELAVLGMLLFRDRQLKCVLGGEPAPLVALYYTGMGSDQNKQGREICSAMFAKADAFWDQLPRATTSAA